MARLQIVLVEPEIPPNTGAVARLCAATHSVLHLVEPLGFKLDDSALKRAGMDYWRQVTVRTWPGWEAFYAAHGQGRLHFLTTKVTRSYASVRFQDGDFLILGRESKGLPGSLLAAHAESCITIPMANAEARSLNLSTATAIVLFEALRQLGEV